MGFRPLKRVEFQDTKKAVIGNSQVITVGGMIVPGATTHTKFAFPATATSHYILGVVVGIEQAGKVSEKTSVTVGSDNETTGLYSVVYIPAYIPMEYEADLDDTAGTTTDSDGQVFFTLADANTLDESVIILYSGTVAGDSAYPHFWSNGATSYSTKKVTGHIGRTKTL